MKLIVGLGNPGRKYQFTRHNVGFLAVDRMIELWKASGPTSKNNAEIFETSIAGEKVLLVKPQTYMNLSGQSVGPLFKFYKLSPEDLIVVQDDIDLTPFSFRIKTGGGTGGHNGLKSIDEHLGSVLTGYHRIRIGVGKDPLDVKGHVLDEFRKEDYDLLDEALQKAAEASRMLVTGNVKEAMNEFNQKSKD